MFSDISTDKKEANSDENLKRIPKYTEVKQHISK